MAVIHLAGLRALPPFHVFGEWMLLHPFCPSPSPCFVRLMSGQRRGVGGGGGVFSGRLSCDECNSIGHFTLLEAVGSLSLRMEKGSRRKAGDVELRSGTWGGGGGGGQALQ